MAHCAVPCKGEEASSAARPHVAELAGSPQENCLERASVLVVSWLQNGPIGYPSPEYAVFDRKVLGGNDAAVVAKLGQTGMLIFITAYRE